MAHSDHPDLRMHTGQRMKASYQLLTTVILMITGFGSFIITNTVCTAFKGHEHWVDTQKYILTFMLVFCKPVIPRFGKGANIFIAYIGYLI